MTALHKRRLIQHLESALRDYEWIRHRNEQGETARDQDMREACKVRRIEAENNIADCREMLDMVRAMKTHD